MGPPVLEQQSSTVALESLSSSDKAKSRQGSFIAAPLHGSNAFPALEIPIVNSDFQNVMVLMPSSNHSLVYTCTSEYIVVGIASVDAELHASFSATMGPLDACNLANSLFHALKTDVDMLVQTQ
jgi:hypothetical protein